MSPACDSTLHLHPALSPTASPGWWALSMPLCACSHYETPSPRPQSPSMMAGISVSGLYEARVGVGYAGRDSPIHHHAPLRPPPSRLVGTLRQRTLDAVEAIAAWHRKTGSPDPFVYYGADYLACVGVDLQVGEGASGPTCRWGGALGLIT